MNEKFVSLDSIVDEIKAECEARCYAAERRADIAEVEARLCRQQLAEAHDARSYAENVASRLISYFDIAEQALGKAREFALTIPQATTEVKTEPPKAEFESQATTTEDFMEGK